MWGLQSWKDCGLEGSSPQQKEKCVEQIFAKYLLLFKMEVFPLLKNHILVYCITSFLLAFHLPVLHYFSFIALTVKEKCSVVCDVIVLKCMGSLS